MRTLRFNCYDEFACTGPECEDTCCKNWNIYLSKREYLDFKKMECSPRLRAALDSSFRRTRSDNDNQYARVDFGESDTCPLLGEDRLCMLQKEMGESALTFVCSVFPRTCGRVGDDALVFSLSPTCYHVVELLMQHPEGLSLIEEEYDGKNNWANMGRYSAPPIPSDAETFPYIWLIKTAQLDILQNREFTIAERLLILGYYTTKACEYLKSSPEKLGQLGAMMLDKELCRKVADSLKTPQSDLQAVAKSNDILFKMTELSHRSEPDHFLTKRMDVIADSVELAYEKTDDGRHNVYWNNEAYARNLEMYRRIEEERPYITENLLAALAFSAAPQNGEELWADYFALAVLYNFLRIGTAAFLPEGYTDKELAMAYTTIVKILVNSGAAKRVVMEDFARNGTNSLSYVAFLIS